MEKMNIESEIEKCVNSKASRRQKIEFLSPFYICPLSVNYEIENLKKGEDPKNMPCKYAGPIISKKSKEDEKTIWFYSICLYHLKKD